MKSSATAKVFLISGVSSGFGLAFAKAALSDGHIVIGTFRTEEAKSEFERLSAGRSYGVRLDVTDFAAIDAVVADVTELTGPVDVLVNNAGYGHEGIMEESPLSELQHQFAVNVFGAVAMTKAVLPSMRLRRTGHIINITSLAGFAGAAGISYYAGSKFALEGISEALAEEVRGFGVRVTALAPGAFRTDWAGRSLVRTERSIDDYDEVFDPIRQARKEKDGRQRGDPAKAARVLLDLIAYENPPVHLLIGKDALSVAKQKLARLSAEIEEWEEVSSSTDL